MAIKNKKIVTKTVETVKSTATKANAFALKSTEEVVSGAIQFTAQWQDVSKKAITGGLKLADAQQDILFNTLEAAKGHAIKGFKRSKALFTK